MTPPTWKLTPRNGLLNDASKRYQVVDEADPGVMKVEVALLDAEAATPGVRSVTMVVPQLRLLSAGYALVAGRYRFPWEAWPPPRSRTP
jgi:hypothetical protein